MSKSQYNYGIALLRIFFCFMVVCFHFHGLMEASYSYYFLRELAVPMFILIAFFFGERAIVSKDIKRYGNRIVRIIVPYFAWGIICFVLNRIMAHFMQIEVASFKDLLLQLAFGSSRIDSPLWFMWVLLVLTIVFMILYKLLPDKAFCIVIVVVSVGCYVLQYTMYNVIVWTHFREEISNSFGRLAEVFPCATAGFLLAHYDVANKAKGNKKVLIPILAILIVLIDIFAANIPSPLFSFAYSGVKFLLAAVVLLLLFYIIPFEKCPKYIRRVIEFVSKYSMGIYCVHWIGGQIIDKAWVHFGGVRGAFIECIVIFLACLLGCFIVSLIPNKWTKMLVQ